MNVLSSLFSLVLTVAFLYAHAYRHAADIMFTVVSLSVCLSVIFCKGYLRHGSMQGGEI